MLNKDKVKLGKYNNILCYDASDKDGILNLRLMALMRTVARRQGHRIEKMFIGSDVHCDFYDDDEKIQYAAGMEVITDDRLNIGGEFHKAYTEEFNGSYVTGDQHLVIGVGFNPEEVLLGSC